MNPAAPRKSRENRTGIAPGKAGVRNQPRYVVIATAPGTQILDVTGPFQVFARATQVVLDRSPKQPAPYRVEVVTIQPGPVTTCCGLLIEPHRTLEECVDKIDTFLIAGGTDIEEGLVESRVLRWVRDVSRSARRVGSICTGAFLLAQAGLLDHKTVTTHWRYCERLALEYPHVRVDPDPIFTHTGNIYTSAGVTAGMDLALALVEEDLGFSIALQVARDLVLYLRRPGSQSQFSAPLIVQASEKEPFRDLGPWILDHAQDDLSIDALARHCYMSTRNFFRLFSAEFSMTPGKFVERIRVEAACRRLHESRAGLETIAAECGFRSADVMRSVFKRVLNVSPKEYRTRFSSARCAHVRDS